MWSALDNPFDNGTKDNFKKGLKLDNYHEAVLRYLKDNDPDPDYTILHARYLPLHIAYNDGYTDWKLILGGRESKTKSVDILLEEMTVRIGDIDYEVQKVYRDYTVEYKAIFPDGRKPFHRGGKEDRITAVETLAKSMQNDASLAAAHTLANDYFIDLNNAQDAQAGQASAVKTASANLETFRLAAMTAQWQNTGFMLNKFPDQPALIEPLFDLDLLRDNRQTLFTGTLAIGENKHILTHTFIFDDEIRVKIIGAGPIDLYLASVKNGTDSTKITAAGNTEQIILASQFGITEYGLNRHLTAINSSGQITQFEVEIE